MCSETYCVLMRFQLLPDVLPVREPDLRAADVAEDTQLEASLQVLPLDSVRGRSWTQFCPLHHRRMVLRSVCLCCRRLHLQVHPVQGVSHSILNFTVESRQVLTN